MRPILDKAVEHVLQNARALKDAPLVFVAVLVLAVGVAFWLANLRYQGAVDQKQSAIDGMKTQIDGLKDQIGELKQKLAARPGNAPPMTPPRDPDALYQFGELVARAPGGTVDRSSGVAAFRSVIGGPNFNVRSAMDYRQFILTNCRFEASSEQRNMGVLAAVGYGNVACQISGAYP